jgi:hypothetical protein
MSERRKIWKEKKRESRNDRRKYCSETGNNGARKIVEESKKTK